MFIPCDTSNNVEGPAVNQDKLSTRMVDTGIRTQNTDVHLIMIHEGTSCFMSILFLNPTLWVAHPG